MAGRVGCGVAVAVGWGVAVGCSLGGPDAPPRLVQDVNPRAMIAKTSGIARIAHMIFLASTASRDSPHRVAFRPGTAPPASFRVREARMAAEVGARDCCSGRSAASPEGPSAVPARLEA